VPQMADLITFITQWGDANGVRWKLAENNL
jgi:hypothetical protein